MRGLHRALTGIAVAALMVGLVEIPIVATSDFLHLRGLYVVLVLMAGWGWVAAGLFAWVRRPDNRTGSLMVLIGFLWFVGAAGSANLALVFTFGNVFANVFIAAVVHLLLAFPTGELRGRFDRMTVRLSYGLTTVGLLPLFLFSDPAGQGCGDCPRNVILIEDNDAIVDAWSGVVNLLGILVILGAVITIAHRWRRAARPERRTLVPVFVSGGVLLGMFGLSLAADLASLSDPVQTALVLSGYAAFAMLPYVFLGELARSRILRAGAVSQLLARLAEAPGPGELRAALARALNDDSLTLAYWLPEVGHYVDSDGRRVEPPEPGSGRVMTQVEREGECIGAIFHRPYRPDDERLIEDVAGAAALALENERLGAELQARLQELSASRTRIVEAGVAERRRLERDLHDGAQQRLVSLALTMRLARSKIPSAPQEADELLENAGKELDLALAELRELARGIHPAVLTDRGLGAALEALAGRAPLPVELVHDSDEALPDAVETAAYFVVAESLTNVAKYSHATQARVSVSRVDGHVLVEVADDGVGGADPGHGSGLRGLADRVSALDGRLSIASPDSGGTTVSARIPCG